MTETSYPPCRSVVASFQTRRSKGTGRFSTIMAMCRGRVRLPADSIVPTAQLLILWNTNQVDNQVDDELRPAPASQQSALDRAVNVGFRHLSRLRAASVAFVNVFKQLGPSSTICAHQTTTAGNPRRAQHRDDRLPTGSRSRSSGGCGRRNQVVCRSHKGGDLTYAMC